MNATNNSQTTAPLAEFVDRGSIYHVESVEFGCEWDRYTALSSDATVPPDQPSYNPSQVESEPEKDRPHQKQDDSDMDPAGFVKTTIAQLCSYQSVAWASEVITYTTENVSHTLTTVSITC